MRLPSLILLASAALALTVQAQESNIVDVVVQVNGEIQAQEPHSPVPEVTAPRREGKDYEPQHAGPAIPEATAPRSRRKSIAVQADDASPADPEVTAPRPGRGVQTDTVGPALPGATAPIQAGKAVAAKVVISAIAVDEDEVDEDGGKRGNGRKGRSESKGKVKGDARAKGKGEEELWEEPTRTTDPEAEAVPEPEVTAPRSPGHGFQAQAHFARPAVPAITAPRELGKSIKKTIKVKVLCRGGDVVKAGATVPGPEVTAPAPQVTAPVMEAEGVLIPSEAGSHIDAVQVRVNGKVVADGEEGLAIAQVNSPGPDDTAPAPKAAIAAPPDPSKHIAETKFIHQKNALGGRSSASETKPSGLLNGLLDGLLGIGLGGKKKKSKGPPTDDDEKDWDHLRLYGDDGYVPRPLPIQPNGEPNCEVLAFRDQMVRVQISTNFFDPFVIKSCIARS